MAVKKLRTGLYPGTFDPMTNGHVDIIRRSLALVDHLVIAMGINASKAPLLTFDERVALIEVDYEYEAQMVGMNRIMNPKVETVFLAASPETQFISSTLVRQIAGMGGDISKFVPKRVEKKIFSALAKLKKS